MKRRAGLHAAALAALLSVLPCAASAQPEAPSGDYVAMGSSFAAGPGLPPYVEGAAARCARSTRNYAHLLAARRGLSLRDVSCSAATTAALLQPWQELPAQIEALGPETKLVSITIGGNDLGYVGSLLWASCQQLAAEGRVPAARCRPTTAGADAASLAALQAALRAVVAAVRSRSPRATLVLVDYLQLLPEQGGCALTPLSAAQADEARRSAQALAALTQALAQESGVLLLRASALSASHHVCADQPWVWGYPATDGGAPYHPNAQGMQAVAEALDQLLPR